MLDLLPTAATVAGLIIWLCVLAVAAVATRAVVGVSEWIEFEYEGWVTVPAPVVIVALALLDVALLVRFRDVFWNDTWVSVALVILLVIVGAGFAVGYARSGDSEAIWTELAAAVSAGLAAVVVLLWGAGHVIDTVVRALALPSLGAVILAVAIVGYFIYRD